MDTQVRPDTGTTLMKLRALLETKTGQKWSQTAKVNPVFADDPYSPFKVSLRLSGEFVGQWPCDVDEATLDEIAQEIVEQNELSLKALQPETDEDGNVVADPKNVGRLVDVVLPSGHSRTVQVKRQVPKETESQEEARVKSEVEGGPLVPLEHDGEAMVIGHNGYFFTIREGENQVPKYIYDRYVEAKRANKYPGPPLDIDERSKRGLPPIPSKYEVDVWQEWTKGH